MAPWPAECRVGPWGPAARGRGGPGAGRLASRVVSGVDDVQHRRTEPQPEMRGDLFDHDKVTGAVLPRQALAAVTPDNIDGRLRGQPGEPHQRPLPVVHRAAGLDRVRPPALGDVVARTIRP